MNDRTVGRVIRLLRHRQGLRQQDLGDMAGVSQGTISLLERGQIDRLALRTLRAVLGKLDASTWLDIRWQGGILDQLLDERHATLVGAVATSLTARGWEVVPEVSYSVFGERGSIDLVGWHAASRTLLIIEVKTELVSVEATLRKHDEKVRLGPKIVAERFGWRQAAVGRLLVLPSERTPRRHVERHAAVLGKALPVRGHDVRRWLRHPQGSVAALWFVSDANAANAGSGVDKGGRVRKPPPDMA